MSAPLGSHFELRGNVVQLASNARRHLVRDNVGVLVESTPVLVLDMYEHAYHIDFGANAIAYIDAFMRRP